MTKPRTTLDLPDVTDFKPRTTPPITDLDSVKQAAETAGFKTRHADPEGEGSQHKSFDARSLRKSNKTAKLNIALSEANRERFWTLAQHLGCTGGEETLVALMDHLDSRN